MTKVERITPTDFLPYDIFSPQAPYAVSTRWSGSDSSGKVRPSASRKRASLAGWSGEMPSTVKPAPSRSARLSRKSQACLVQPPVIGAG